jgi:predicted ATPase/DNA-binding SARP family transcriptional activator/DNA-binding CsgD family transcriptional regulator
VGEETVRIRLLGGFSVSVGTRNVRQDAWRLGKAANLVKLLALASGHRLHREQLMDLLWPDLGLRAASNNLRQALHVARRTLHPDPAVASRYLSLSGGQLMICPEGRLWVDVEAFEQAATTARRSKDPAAYRAAIELYSGDLLPEDRYEGWAEERRETLRQTRLRLLVELARLYEERGEKFGPAIETLGEAVGQEPTNEEAHVSLMRLYALCGRKGEALAQYGRLEEVLARELGTEPAASSRALREEIASGRLFSKGQEDDRGTPHETPTGIGSHNLPAPRSSFVGREREMLETKRALAMTRLLTLTGAGGSGKTRLALEVGRDLVGAYPDGVWLTELAGISEGELVPQAVARALGVHERPGQQLTDALVETLRAKSILLLLDNCEHLVDAAARLADVLLDGCPHLRVLATSREALGVVGESVWPVPALSVPDSQRPPTVAELEGYEAARLFAERASDRLPGFALGPANVGAVAEVCRGLDGVPLALELAAARVGTMSVEQISERLGDSLGLLTGGARTAATRQRTLRGALDWSHELLDEPERALFRRLSVFVGGWTLEAAEAVAPGEGVERGKVLELLSGLVDKSMVIAEAARDGRIRYRLLEPVRQYALEKLEESGEAEAVRHRHTEHFLALAEEAEPRFRRPEEARWLDRLEAEHDNLRAALSWALGDGDPGLGLRLAAALWKFWTTRGLGLAAPLRGEPERAKTLLKESLAMDVKMGAKADIAENLEGLAEAAGALGEDLRSARLWGAARALREATGRPWWSVEHLLHEPQPTAAHARLDQASWDAAFEEGQAMSFEEVVEYALSEQMPATPAFPAPYQPSAVKQSSILTAREGEVAAMVARGLSNRQIASELYLSERTVENHVSKILRKLALASRTQIAAWATEQRLLVQNSD